MSFNDAKSVTPVTPEPPASRRKNTGGGIALGVALGVALGFALHSVALGFALGVAFAVSVGAARSRSSEQE